VKVLVVDDAAFMRMRLKKLLEDQGYEVVEAPFTAHDVYNAEECFLTGTAAEVVPVVEVDGRKIGTGRPGPVARELIAAYRDLVRREGTPIFESEALAGKGGGS